MPVLLRVEWLADSRVSVRVGDQERPLVVDVVQPRAWWLFVGEGYVARWNTGPSVCVDFAADSIVVV